jgi:23S rRNA pseudouridine2457 synthase
VIILFNKPYGVLCQFTDQEGRLTLANFIDIPEVYAAGRLDKDSEGLVALTEDGKMQHRIAHPENKMSKRYAVQVEGEIDDEALKVLASGVKLKDGMTLPARATRIKEPLWLWDRTPPVRFRKAIPTSWLELEISEGRNRQVRRMTAAAGYPTLRLIRTHIGKWSLENLSPGEWIKLD